MGDRKSDLKNTRFYGLKLSKSTDGALIAKLDGQESVQGYIKSLIRADIMKGERKTMTYKIKPEYADLWGEDVNEDTIITESDLEMIARGWEKTPDELMDQLIPQE